MLYQVGQGFAVPFWVKACSAIFSQGFCSTILGPGFAVVVLGEETCQLGLLRQLTLMCEWLCPMHVQAGLPSFEAVCSCSGLPTAAWQQQAAWKHRFVWCCCVCARHGADAACGGVCVPFVIASRCGLLQWLQS